MVKVGYKSIKEISGPLIFVEGISNAGYNEMVSIETPDGQIRSGQVLDTRKGMAVVQVFGATTGLDNRNTVVRFTGEASKISVSDSILGRIFNGLGEPIDQGPAIVSKEKLEIVGSSMNPYSREEPSEFIQTGISTIDGMNTLVRGQKLPIFSGSGLSHNMLAAQIARQAKVIGKDEGEERFNYTDSNPDHAR